MQLLEACRAKDRLDKLDELLRGEVTDWARLSLRVDRQDYVLVIDKALTQANSTAVQLKQLLAALRLPDTATGKRAKTAPARGAYLPRNLSSLDRARAKAAG